MTRRRFLPKYVTTFIDVRGKERLRFRRKGFKPHYFQAPLGTEAFREEYRRCMEQPETPLDRAIERTFPGSIGELMARYCAAPSRLGPTQTTQKKVRAVLEKFSEPRRDWPVADLRFEHIDAILEKRREKKIVKGRPEGGVEAARKLRKELIRLFDFGIKTGMMTLNPAAQSSQIKVAAGERSTGFYTWTEKDIAQYRDCHALGTRARLAMELMLWTDQRRIDSIHLGRQHISGGRIAIRQTKTGKELSIPVAPQLLEAIVAMPPGSSSPMCFLLTEWGKPFTNAGFGNWFREKCDEAGLPHCTAHGLRKATMRRMAEIGLGNQTMKALSGHTKDDEVARYTAAANQKRMADNAISALAQWEKQTQQAVEAGASNV